MTSPRVFPHSIIRASIGDDEGLSKEQESAEATGLSKTMQKIGELVTQSGQSAIVVIASQSGQLCAGGPMMTFKPPRSDPHGRAECQRMLYSVAVLELMMGQQMRALQEMRDVVYKAAGMIPEYVEVINPGLGGPRNQDN
jgi:hypothetical protein